MQLKHQSRDKHTQKKEQEQQKILGFNFICLSLQIKDATDTSRVLGNYKPLSNNRIGLDLCHPQDLTAAEAQARPVFVEGDDETLYDPLYARQCMFSDWCAAANITSQKQISYRNVEKVFYKGFTRWVCVIDVLIGRT